MQSVVGDAYTVISKGLKYASDCLPRIYLDLADYHQTVFLAGTGRSGTTWLEDIIDCQGSYRVMFEPFHSKKVDVLKGWNYRQYLRPSNRDEKFLEPATKILSGRIRGKWIDKFRCKPIVTRRLIKDIRANLILKWIKQNFPEIRIILLLRHPCAVASSKLKLGWETHLEDFLAQQELMEDYLNPFRSHIEGAQDLFERHIFMWCIENYVPLRQFGENEICVVFYERLCVSPEESVRELFNFLDQPFPSEVLHSMRRPSALSRKGSAILTGGNLIDAWRPAISSQQMQRSLQILELFGLQKIYGESSLPLVNGKEALRVLAT